VPQIDEVLPDTPDAPDTGQSGGVTAGGGGVSSSAVASMPVNEFNVDNADTPDSGQNAQASVVSPAVPSSGVHHRQFLVVWDSDKAFVTQATGPFRWIISYADGTSIALPSAAVIQVTSPDGIENDVTADLENTAADIQQVLAIDFLMDQIGGYSVKLLARFGTEVAGAVQPITVS
jgi:hypothetical protein